METTALSHALAGLSPAKRALLERRLAAGRGVGEQAIPRRSGVGPCALSFAQQRLWFLAQMEPGRSAYNIARGRRRRGGRDVGALRGALEAIVGRHEALRTTVVVAGEEPQQVVAERWALAVPGGDRRGVAEGERGAELERVLRAEARRPFDLAADLMLRVLLVRVGVEEHVVLLTMHHIATDGWSMGVLTRELTAAYTALRQGGEAGLGADPVWGLRGVAAGVAAGGRVREAAELLEGAGGGGAADAGAADGSAAAGGADAPGGAGNGGAAAGGGGGAARGEPAGAGDAVHDAAGGVCGAAAAVYGGRGRGGGDGGGGAAAGRDRAADRLFREHAGAAGGSTGGPDVSGVLGAGSGDGAGGV